MSHNLKDSLAITVAAYRQAWRQYADFAGRTTRIDYWRFFVINLVIALCLSWLWPPLALLYALAILVPGLAIIARRLHDTGRSTKWLILPLAIWAVVISDPLLVRLSLATAWLGSVSELGLAVWLIVLMALPGQPLANRWGEPPVRD